MLSFDIQSIAKYYWLIFNLFLA